MQNQKRNSGGIEQTQYDLIISDFTLPAYSGMEHSPPAGNFSRTRHSFLSLEPSEKKGGGKPEIRRYRLCSEKSPQSAGPAVRRALREAHERKERQRAEEQVRVQSSALEAVANGIILTTRGENSFRQPGFCA